MATTDTLVNFSFYIYSFFMLRHIEMFLKVAAFKNNLVELISCYAVYVTFYLQSAKTETLSVGSKNVII